jgi:hypothetical protein
MIRCLLLAFSLAVFAASLTLAAPVPLAGQVPAPGYDIRLVPENPIGSAFRLRVAANKWE